MIIVLTLINIFQIYSVEFYLKYEKYNLFNNKYEVKGILWILIIINEKSFNTYFSILWILKKSNIKFN